MQIDPGIDKADCIAIVLGKETFYAPQIPFKSARKLIPTIIEITPKLQGMSDTGLTALDDEMFGKISDVLVLGLSRAYPEMTAETLGELPMKLLQIVRAVGAIAKQAGLTEEGSDTGEAVAATAAPQSTSTESLPTTANAAESPGPTN